MLTHERTSTLLASAALICSFVAAVPVAAQEPDRAKVTVRLGATYRSGATSFGKTTGDTKPLAPGETASMVFKAALAAGGGLVTSYSPSATESLGGVSGGIVAGSPATPPPPPPLPPGAAGSGRAVPPLPPPPQTTVAYSWGAEVRVVSISPAAIKVEMKWNRTGPTGTHDGDTRTISLRPDERHVLDFVQVEDKSVANLFVDVGASRVEDPAFANLGILYEVWLVHETADGQKITRPLRGCSGGTPSIGGHQGDTVSFDFDPILFSVDAAQPIDGSRGPVEMRVRGAITGRARKDNTIELVVRTERTVRPRNLEREVPKMGGGGEKVFVVRPDETTSVELPPANGSFSWNAGKDVPSTPRPGVEARPNGNLLVLRQAFFEGTKTSLVIKVRAMLVGIFEK